MNGAEFPGGTRRSTFWNVVIEMNRYNEQCEFSIHDMDFLKSRNVIKIEKMAPEVRRETDENNRYVSNIAFMSM